MKYKTLSLCALTAVACMLSLHVPSAFAQCDATFASHQWGQMNSVRVRNGIAYIVFDGHLEIKNISNHAIPINLGSVAVPGTPMQMRHQPL